MKVGPVILQPTPTGTRCYLRVPASAVGDYRIHHGPVGILLMFLGLVMLASDWRDRPWRARPRRLSVEEHEELRQG